MDPFFIMPTLGIAYYNNMQIDTYRDNAMRASLINAGLALQPNGFTFVTNGTLLTGHTIISPVAATLQGEDFPAIFSDNDINSLTLSLGLV